VKKIRNRRALAGLILAACVTLSIAYAGTGGAAPPTTGNTCIADGKITGRGATFQTRAQQAWAAAFTRDVCGNVTDAAAGNDMVLYNGYNPPSAAGAQLTGSGFGQKAMSCRTDAFAGTDIPYDNATLKQLNEVPGSVPIGGATNNCSASAATATGFGADYNPPYPPNGHPGVYPTGNCATTPAPCTGDQTKNLMSFPVTGSAVVVAANLNGNDGTGTPICSSTTKPTALTLTGTMINGLFGGTITHWNDPALIAGGRNGQLTTDGCTGPVTRVVRLDKSGTTQIFKFYLEAVNQATPLCDGTSTWGNDLALDAGNQTWPTGGTCSGLARGDVNGNNGVFDICSNKVALPAGQPTGGFICYGDLPDYQAFTGGTTTIRSTVQAGVGTAFTSPVSGTSANCNFGLVSLPTVSTVGLNVDSTGTGVDTWALDNSGGVHGDIANQGTKYPICGVTYDLVFQGLGQGTTGGSDSAISGLTADQRRTLYSYELYILSSAGQNEMTKFFYGALPETVVAAVRSDFSAATGF
jgi:ABC-type phosphate transport system substrate-binding protein